MNTAYTNTIHTNATHTTTLSRKEQEGTHRVTALCRLVDGLSLSYPGDRDECWILEEDIAAATFLAVYKIEVIVWECYIFTYPDLRREGYFFLLPEQICRYSGALGEPELYFVAGSKYPATMAVLQELKAELWNGEYMIEYDVPAAGTAYESGVSVSQASLLDTELGTEPDTELGMGIHITPKGLLICARTPGDNPPAGGNGITSPDTNSGTDDVPGARVSCRLSLDGTGACLCSLEAISALRRRGLTDYPLAQLIRHLECRGVRRICLQISGSNEPVLRLCQRTGFRTMEALSYYLY